jgi:predicted kinase
LEAIIIGNLYIFRGKSATGKSTFADLLVRKLSIPVIRIDDIIDALKTTPGIDKSLINNVVCYNILCKTIQTNLDLGADFIVDVGLGHRKYAQSFYSRFDFRDTNVFSFMTICSDEKEWERRHIERIENPLPHQSFQSLEHVLAHYANIDATPLDNEHILDSACALEDGFKRILQIIGLRTE